MYRWENALRIRQYTQIIRSVCASWFVVFAMTTEVTAAVEETRLCDKAALTAGQRHGVPVEVLMALNRTETGRMRNGSLEPWPWTVNLEGKGTWFSTAPEAIDYARRSAHAGRRSFDVGCFQLNYRWHGEHFKSIEHMFDPTHNADYAAKFLSDLYREKGNWLDAAAAYHSRTPSFATKYKTRFSRILSRLDAHSAAVIAGGITNPNTTVHDPDDGKLATNFYPLLYGLSDATNRNGSLFPAGTTPATPIISGASAWNK